MKRPPDSGSACKELISCYFVLTEKAEETERTTTLLSSVRRVRSQGKTSIPCVFQDISKASVKIILLCEFQPREMFES